MSVLRTRLKVRFGSRMNRAGGGFLGLGRWGLCLSTCEGENFFGMLRGVCTEWKYVSWIMREGRSGREEGGGV